MNLDRLVSVVIVTYNNESILKHCLESLVSIFQVFDIEVVLVDNASSDGTRQIIEQYACFRAIYNTDNLGYSQANNQGILATQNPYILLLNPDSLLTPGFLPAAIAAMKDHPEVALLTGKVYAMDQAGQPVMVEGCAVIDSVGLGLKHNRQTINTGEREIDQGQYDQEREIFAVSGSVCLCRREALLQAMIDGQIFDDFLFTYKEDLDLAWRLRTLGWKCWYAPAAIAYHTRHWKVGRGNRKKVERDRRFYSFRNRRIVIMKNESLLNFSKNMLFILGFELFSFGYALLIEPFLLKAYPEIIQDLPRIRFWRSEIRNKVRKLAGDGNI